MASKQNSKRRTAKRVAFRPIRVKFPTLAQMQLGNRSFECDIEGNDCGCVLVHRGRIADKGRCEIEDARLSPLWDEYAFMGIGLSVNTLSNRKRGLACLRDTLIRSGLRILRDRTILAPASSPKASDK